MIFLKPFIKCFRNLEPLFGYSPNLLDCVLPQQETFQFLRSGEQTDDLTKPFSAENLQNPYFAQLFR